MRDKVSRQETAEIAPRTMSVPEAGRIYLGIGRNSAYEAAHRGDLPVIRIGKLLRVPVAAMERKLAEVASR
jgi:excisionase family DNA binding protein